MSCGDNKPRIAVIGAGLVGCLATCYLAKRGFCVEVFESRNDIRQEKLVEGRSINLALSNRGLAALSQVGITEELLQPLMVPMSGRMIHLQDGSTKAILYDQLFHRCINSIGRNDLNRLLLTEAEKHENVIFNFKRKLVKMDLKTGLVVVSNMAEEDQYEERVFDTIVGCDGAYSVVRQQMSRWPLFTFSQTYIQHAYMELTIPASKVTKELMVGNHLHIWPRIDFMLIALPNKDDSWTAILFMPFQQFACLNKPSSLTEFFEKNFPDALKMIGNKNLNKMFYARQPQPLISIKCEKYFVSDKAFIMGDAAHAIVPFYGQGMNAGFEDCFVMNELLEKFNDNFGQVITEFSKRRVPEGQAISELSMYNYLEMRNLVLSRAYQIRKNLDDKMHAWFGEKWTPLYIGVTFSRTPYSQCILNKKRQDQILKMCGYGVTFSILFVLISNFFFHDRLIALYK